MRQIVLVVLMVATMGISLAQDEDKSVFSFTLQQAVDYALLHNEDMKNAELEIKKSKKKVWETTAIGLPQVNGEAGYTYMLTVPEQIEQFSAFSELFNVLNLYSMGLNQNGITPDPQQVGPDFSYPTFETSEEESDPDALKESITADLTVSQLIFSGPYIVGLQAARAYKDVSNISYDLTRQEVIVNVTNAYYTALIAKENLKNIDSTFENTRKTLNEFEKMLDQGLMDKTDVDQMRLTLKNIESSRTMLLRMVDISERLLKFQVGVELTDSLVLKDNLPVLIDQMRLDASLEKEFVLEENINYQMLKKQEELSELSHKRQKSESLPTLSAFYRHHEEFNEEAFTFTAPDMVGVSLSVPIFSSFQRSAKVSQTKIELEKTRNSNKKAFQGLALQYEEARSNYKTALDKYQIQKERVQLSRTIYQNTFLKYQQGMSSSMDITQAQNQYLTAQSDYYQAIVDLVNAKLKMDKLLNNL